MPLVFCALTYLLFCAASPFLLTHPKLRQGIWRRLGLYPRGWPQLRAGPRVWVHGASAGDILALLPTVRELKARRPDVQIVASTMTNSGHAMALQHLGLLSAVTYVPYDLPGATARAIERIQPDALVLEYTELWPHLIRAATRRKIPIVLHNGRLAESRVRRYRRLFRLTGNLLRPLTLLLMRDEHEAARARALGAADGKVMVTGNTKFDNLGQLPAAAMVDGLQAALGPGTEGPIWVAGSTHEGEEEALFEVFVQLRQHVPQLTLLIAPRYTERAERVAALAGRRGLQARLRSTLPGRRPDDVVVLNTIGELSAAYQLATLVFVGGSFVPRGGQNILEPAACGRTVLFGPHMHNFADSVQVLLGRGGIQVATPLQLQRVMLDLLQRPTHCQELGVLARSQVRAVRGAAARNAVLIAGLLPAPLSQSGPA
jgi:3-deoxy-D-manno-octulosonic-acid transferase